MQVDRVFNSRFPVQIFCASIVVLTSFLTAEAQQEIITNKSSKVATQKKLSNPEITQYLASFLGLRDSNHFVQELVRSEVRKPKPAVPATIVKHLKAEGGIPFASTAEYEKIQKEEFARWLAKPENKAKIGKPIKTKKSAVKIPPLKPCAGSKVEKADSGYSGNPSRSGQLKFDYLFIHNDDLGSLRSERSELFGSKVNIKIIAADQLGAETTARGFNVQCLPTRIRATRQTVYTLTGEPALRNYDRDPNGVGELHELMQEVAAKYK